MVNFKRYGKKQGKRILRYGKKRYYNSKSGSLNTNRMLQDVAMLKSIINAEKKEISVLAGASTVGQVNGNADGLLVLDVTPVSTQGTGDSQHSGDSIKVTTGMFNFQFSHMSALQSNMRIYVELYTVLGKPQATSDVLNQLYKPNPFITGANIRDYNSVIDQDYRQQYKLIASRKVYIKSDQYSGQNLITECKMPLRFGKFGHHVKFQENSSNVASGQLILVIRADTGNISGSTTSTLSGVINSAVNTGVYVNKNLQYYYYDN